MFQPIIIDILAKRRNLSQ